MSTEIVLNSDAAKKLLPESYKGRVNLNSLASSIQKASKQGSASLIKLKDVTSGGWLSQAWNSTDINRCVHDSLESIATLSEAQIALQAVTAEINQKTLNEQKIIAQQQQQLASQQIELAAHSGKIEELILLSDQSDLIEDVTGKILNLQSQVKSIDPERIVAWQVRIEKDADDLNKQLSAELSKWLERLNQQIKVLGDAIQIAVDNSDQQYKLIRGDISNVKSEVFNSTQNLDAAIKLVDSKSDEKYQELQGQAGKIIADFDNNTKILSDAIKNAEDKSDRRYEEIFSESEKMKAALVNANEQIKTHQKIATKLKNSIIALSLVQSCVTALVLFFVFR